MLNPFRRSNIGLEKSIEEAIEKFAMEVSPFQWNTNYNFYFFAEKLRIWYGGVPGIDAVTASAWCSSSKIVSFGLTLMERDFGHSTVGSWHTIISSNGHS